MSTGLTEKEPKQPNFTEQWGKLLELGLYWAIQKSEEAGMSSKELLRLVREDLVRRIKNDDSPSVYGFLSEGIWPGIPNLGFTEEEKKEIGVKAYEKLMADENFSSAAEVAGRVYGLEGEEYRAAFKLAEDEQKRKLAEVQKRRKYVEVEEELRVVLPPEATMADLFRAIDDIVEKEGLEKLYFEAKLWESGFDKETVKEVLSLREDDERADEAAKIKVIEFFEKHGYDKDDITAFLPIKFRRKKKNER